ncbi:efflux RND transporter periplasmic adaptor subunit [Glaciihabitans sp. dw_435]|uniref:efflux RND transporter periplasmic adaptor subunit n=1 Tax=Glaciihabitans sp. dw_435 TaxID=2720081 RepID=UPI001BD4DFE2|nr:efflux RND transporter periplasmic adaptor subunit [Glaciihabitans sp. dw_435]
MKLPRPAITNTVLAVVILAAGTGAYFVINPVKTATATATQLTGTVQTGAVSSTISASGSIAAKQEVAVSFAQSGTIKSVNTTLGATVKKGTVLGTLATSDFTDAIDTATKGVTKANEGVTNAEADLQTAYDSLTTAKAALAKDPSKTQDVTSARSQIRTGKTNVESAEDAVDTAQQTLDDAEDALSDTTLKAPIAGLVIAVSGQVGGSVSGGSSSSSSGAAASTGTSSSSTSTTTSSSTGFVTIADVSAYTVSASIAEADIASVKVGQVATISFPALDGVTAAAKVTAIAPTSTASNSVVTYATTITLDKVPANIRLGQTATVAITTTSSKATSLYVPTAAITTATDGTSTVKVVKSGVTSTVTVETGVVGDNGTEITSGLTDGETVVLGTVAATTSTTGTTGTTRGGTGTGGFGGGTGGGFTGGGTGGFPGGGN